MWACMWPERHMYMYVEDKIQTWVSSSEIQFTSLELRVTHYLEHSKEARLAGWVSGNLPSSTSPCFDHKLATPHLDFSRDNSDNIWILKVRSPFTACKRWAISLAPGFSFNTFIDRQCPLGTFITHYAPVLMTGDSLLPIYSWVCICTYVVQMVTSLCLWLTGRCSGFLSCYENNS